ATACGGSQPQPLTASHPAGPSLFPRPPRSHGLSTEPSVPTAVEAARQQPRKISFRRSREAAFEERVPTARQSAPIYRPVSLRCIPTCCGAGRGHSSFPLILYPSTPSTRLPRRPVHDYLLTMQLLALALLASAPAAVTAASCSGLSTGAMVAIIVESVVIFLLIVWLLTILRQLQVARNKLKAALAHEEQEYKRGAASEGQADRHHSTTSLVQSPQDDHFEESQVALLPPPSLRPQSRSFSSPSSLRSSTLYDFAPQQEDFGFDLKSYRPTTLVQPPAHVPEVSTTTLPNPHSEHGHGGEHGGDDEEQSMTHESLLATPLPLPAHLAQPSDYSEDLRTPRPGSRALSESSWAADVVGALERGPTPISRTTTATTTTTLSAYTDDGSTPIAGAVHELLLNRQRESGSHSVSGSPEA
ncbi:uncharacterized protein C8Q71DRAFT_310802, partial [Rhodofomes roseus]